MKVLLTGSAGFIGFHVARRLLDEGHTVIGIDNLNDYYDVQLKASRLNQLLPCENFSFLKLDLADRSGIASVFEAQKFDIVIHLGAQAGVRYSIDNPFAYADSNLIGTLAILEGCRHGGVKKLLYASSSSVYGANKKQPFSVKDRVDEPISLYAATKKSNEMMCFTYAHLYGICITGLRFFTVYGPWGRPDMAYFKFANQIVNDGSIDVYNNGEMWRDFTYIDDIVECIKAISFSDIKVLEGEVPHRVYNLGNNNPEKLLEMIDILEQLFSKKVNKNFVAMQLGDVYSTFADISETKRDFGFTPKVKLKDGLASFADWYKSYYSLC